MGGAEHWTLPRVGRRHTIDVDEERWHIRPRFSAVMRVSHVAHEQKVVTGVEMNDAQFAAVKDACVREFLSEPQQDIFNDPDVFTTERQSLLAEKLFRIWNEIRSGDENNSNPDDPAPPAPAESDEPEDAPGPDPTPSPSV